MLVLLGGDGVYTGAVKLVLLLHWSPSQPLSSNSMMSVSEVLAHSNLTMIHLLNVH